MIQQSVGCRLRIVMVSSMKLIQFVQRVHQTIGIYSTQSNQRDYSRKRKRTIFLISCAQYAFTVVTCKVLVAVKQN